MGSFILPEEPLDTWNHTEFILRLQKECKI